MSTSNPTGRFSRATQRKKDGVTYTPPVLARLLARLLFAEDGGGEALSVWDPACGDGALLEAAQQVRRAQDHHDDHWLGTDADPTAVARTRRRLGLSSGRLTVREGDFLASFEGAEPVDRIIANPPWVRTQVLGTARARALAKRFGLKGRVDLAQAFVLAMVDVLKPGGRAAVLVPNKLLQTRGAATFRRVLRDRACLVEVVDLGDTRLFDAAVLPAMLVLERRPDDDRPTPFWSVYTTRDEADAQPVDGFEAIWNQPGRHRLADGRVFEVLTGALECFGAHDSWQRGGPAVRAWLQHIHAHTALRVGDLGPVRVGVKSTADPVFVTPDWTRMPADAQPELLRPLTTHHRARAFLPLPREPRRQILYPHENVDGKRRPVDLATAPRSRAWLEQHRARLEKRTYVLDAGRAWYAIWVPHDPDGWAADKLVFRDIAPRSTCWLDREGTVVNGDCYWLVPKPEVDPELLFLALAVANSSLVDAWYDRVCNNRLYAGRRRYLSQFVSDYPLPDPTLPSSRALMDGARALVDRLQAGGLDGCADAIAELDRQVWTAFGLDAAAPLP